MAHKTGATVQSLSGRGGPSGVVREKTTAWGDIVEEYADWTICAAPSSICIDVLNHSRGGTVAVGGIDISKNLDIRGLQLRNASLVVRVGLRVSPAGTTGRIDDDEEWDCWVGRNPL